MGGIMYRTENLNKSYADGDGVCYALKDVNLDISKGQMVAIVGESGSGKSTLLNILGAIDSATGGKVIANGKNIAGLSEEQLSTYRSKTVGFVFQFFNLISTQNVLENIVLPIHLDNEQVDNDYIEEVIQLLGLEDKKYAFIHELSGGQQQRVAIARALASKPAIIFADEPTGNLDAKSSQEVVDLLKIAQRKYHETVIMVTHDELIASIADRIITIEDGQIVQDTRKVVK